MAKQIHQSKSRFPQQTQTADIQTVHDVNKTLIVTNTSNFSNSVTIKKEFAKVFPLKRPTYAFTTGRVYFHLGFLTETEATEVLEKWNNFSLVIKVKSEEPTRLKNLKKL